MTEQKPILCQNCGEPLHFEAVSEIMNRSKMSMVIEPHEGELLSAETVGGTLTQMSKLLKAMGKDLGHSVNVCVSGLNFDAGKIRFDVVVARQDGKIKPRVKLNEV